MSMNRRSFLRNTLAATAALSLPARIHAAAEGANGDIRLGAIGFNGRGMSNINGLLGVKGVRLTALCDADQNVLDRGRANFAKKGFECETYVDIRKLLESKNVDAVTIATPNHWHSLAGIWAIQAGKDVYVEKPVSHNVWEGRKLVEAARKYDKIVQTGTQSRSSRGHRRPRRMGARRQPRQDHCRARPLLQARAPASARWTGRSRFPPASITISGAAPRR